jgi:anti-sigma regulatory factor (Ser/Thr protein kinase)
MSAASPTPARPAARQLHLRLSARPDAPGTARRALAELPIGQPLLGDLVLLVSELVTNSVMHGSRSEFEPITLDVVMEGPWIRVEVRDRGTGFTLPRAEPDPRRPGGRGLQLVERLAANWGVSREDGGLVWFELRRDLAGEHAIRRARAVRRAAGAHDQTATVHERAARLHDEMAQRCEARGDASQMVRARGRAILERRRAARQRSLAAAALSSLEP